MVSRSESVRLSPRWAVVAMCAMAVMLLVVGTGLAAVTDGVDRWIAAGLALAGLCAVVFLAYGFWPRTPQPLHPGPDGSVSIAAPVLQVAAALTGWLVMLLLAGLIAFVLVTRGMSAVESPGAAVVIVGAALASIPDLVRLLTGRLHRWRLSWGPDGVSYRGYRTSLDLPRGSGKGARLQASRLFRWDDVPSSLRPREGGPRGYGVVLDRSGMDPDVLVPQVFFRVPAEQLRDELGATVRQHRRR